MIQRKNFINKCYKCKDIPLVKIITGVRRCGKSTLLDMYASSLLESGVAQNHIIKIRYTSLENLIPQNAEEMFLQIKNKITESGRYYLFLDEVQEVVGWEKCVNSLLEDFDTDIYVTGSNSKLMSSEISTYLSGRYIELPLFTFSFAEFLEAKKPFNKSEESLLNEYIRFGGFPLLAVNDYDENTNYQVAEGIYHSVVFHDIRERHEISNQDLFNRVVHFVLENLGKTFSANSIVNFLKSQNRPLSVESVYNYLDYLSEAFIVYRCSRFDLQGKNVLKTQEKYYLADSVFKYCLLGFNPVSVASMIENIVFLELKRREYNVYIGKLGEKEIDFVAQKQSERIYVQVCRQLPQNSEREIGNLLSIKDAFPKYVVTMNSLDEGIVDGIKIIHLAKFLLGE